MRMAVHIARRRVGLDYNPRPLKPLFQLARQLLRDPGRLALAARKGARLLREGGVRALAGKLREKSRLGAGPPSPAEYRQWLQRFEPALVDKARALVLPRRPLISVVMPVYETPERWLLRAIESVREQLYAEWELCIADDASQAPHVARVLAAAAALDPRVRFVRRPQNGHISAASDTALELARGEFVALLDHDDELAPDALVRVAQAVTAADDVDLVYSDEDKIGEDGLRFDPYFKPDWNPELFLSQNYVSHLGVYRTALVRACGGFREGFEGSQDYDLALRCSARARRIVHLPRVLYHWRAIAGSTAVAASAKSYAQTAGVRALQESTGAAVEPGPWPTTYRVRRALPDPAPLVSVIIPTRDGGAVLERCLESLSKTSYPHYEVTIVDNGSRDPATLALLSRSSARILRWDAPFNFSAINNFAVRSARGALVALLNDDVEVISPAWLGRMVAHAVRPEVGAVGARLLFPDGRVQHAGVVTGLLGVAGHAHRGLPRKEPGYFGRAALTQGFSAVTAACLVVRRALYEQVGGLDEQHLPVSFNDVDFCLRLRELGLRNVYEAEAELFHHESWSRGADTTREKRALAAREAAWMEARWGDLLLRDPAWNPNLSLQSPLCALAWPPRG